MNDGQAQVTTNQCDDSPSAITPRRPRIQAPDTDTIVPNLAKPPPSALISSTHNKTNSAP
ncbi:hypothetical protein K443DRAFT_4620 [Laccaria amethystina LaAM-08-1]|uniref:Unplaced genomic scaffold K443scaffold_34, whole genome shotgun sequence n=1 Tax=Laccaria amethystina LaAM-08-1 TaxID=1095629 RepID=A0A0C9XHQ0_9AGAR|nr:hypothetical protein K443DRAFT_4620 [Laccaria amethystina LaAM-08-1]